MSGGNKRLTVSYGTFSCTLEGFDDAFEAMKAIAEYFRDLSAQDRYFGATPPTPDLAMLQHIAETETRRQIEARVETDGVVLKAAPSGDAGGPTAAPPRTAMQGPPAESVAARLARIRAMAAKGREGDAPPESIFAEDEGEAAPETPATPLGLPAGDPTALRFEDMGLGIAPGMGLGQDPVPAGLATADDDETSGARPADIGHPAAWPAPLPAEPALPREPQLPRAALAPVAPPPAPASALLDEGGLARARALHPLYDPLPRAGEAELAAPQPVAVPVPDPVADPAPEPVAAPAPEPAPPPAGAEIVEADPDLMAISRMLETESGVRPAAHGSGDVFEAVAERPAAVATGDTTDTAETGETEAMAAGQRGGVEEHLRSFLSKVRLIGRPRGPVSVRPEGAAGAAAAPDGAEAGFDGLGGPGGGEGAGPDDADVDRLVETANSRLEVAESQRRRSAISHLKAAVAATEADRQFGHGAEGEAGGAIDRYRDDLSRIVQMPQRPESRREDMPFVLGSENRVDGAVGPGDGASAARQARSEEVDKFLGMILPRRFSAASIASLDDGDDEMGEDEEPPARAPTLSFPRFAAVAGASDLLDLLEAAAAYLTVHEGRESFSRPQVMRKVAQLAVDEEISREDGLRSFGALLRDGRLQKARRGRFTISQASRFMEVARRTAGGPAT